MYMLPTSNYLRRSLFINHTKHPWEMNVPAASHSARIKRELSALGVTKYGLLKQESRYLPNLIHPSEQLGGVVYGRHEDGSVMLVATDRRVIYVDKKPLFVNEDEITYDVVSGVSFSHVGVGSTVTLHTRIKDYRIRTLNQKCAKRFIAYIESRRLEPPVEGVPQ
jgi:hypothetical protein